MVALLECVFLCVKTALSVSLSLGGDLIHTNFLLRFSNVIFPEKNKAKILNTGVIKIFLLVISNPLE